MTRFDPKIYDGGYTVFKRIGRFWWWAFWGRYRKKWENCNFLNKFD